jgi:putative ABC transport system ATP-binding protein
MRADTAPAAVELSDLRFSWATESEFTLAIESLAVARGETLLLLGPSGSGKSTLLSLICGIVLPDAGTVQVLGQDLAMLGGSRRDRFRSEHIGVIFQMFNLLPYGSALDNVLLPLSFAPMRRGRSGPDAGAEARRVLSVLGLDAGLQTAPAAELSVGQQQRVAAARALIGRPEIIVADEPTSALDRPRQQGFLDLLFDQVGQAGATLIMVSHDDSFTDRFDRVLTLDAVLRRKTGS